MGSSVLDQLLAAARGLPFDELGRSHQGRPILYRRFGDPGAVPPLLVVGGVHGDEPSSVEAVLELGQRLARSRGALDVPVLLLPALNPDGLAQNTKNSARDVDLNRNFPARNFDVAYAPGYFPGKQPLSEPETRLLAKLVDDARVAGVVAVHAPFACVNYDGPAAAWAEAVAAACGWPARGDIGYPTPGSLGSWLGVDRGLPVLTLELPSGPYGAFARAADAALDEAVRRAPWLPKARPKLAE
jgi:protein MpaA